MGMVTIKLDGSFGGQPEARFSAMEGGHAYALTRAIEFLIEQMPMAIRNDHARHDEGERPPFADFGNRSGSTCWPTKEQDERYARAVERALSEKRNCTCDEIKTLCSNRAPADWACGCECHEFD